MDPLAVIACPEAAESAESLPAEDAEGARAEPAESSASEAVREWVGSGTEVHLHRWRSLDCRWYPQMSYQQWVYTPNP